MGSFYGSIDGHSILLSQSVPAKKIAAKKEWRKFTGILPGDNPVYICLHGCRNIHGDLGGKSSKVDDKNKIVKNFDNFLFVRNYLPYVSLQQKITIFTNYTINKIIWHVVQLTKRKERDHFWRIRQ